MIPKRMPVSNSGTGMGKIGKIGVRRLQPVEKVMEPQMNMDRHRFFLRIYTNFFAPFASLREIFNFSTACQLMTPNIFSIPDPDHEIKNCFFGSTGNSVGTKNITTSVRL